MALTGGRRRDGNGSPLVAGTRFFKIILQSTLCDRKLLIPGEFVRNCGECLLESAILKVPSGATWAVDVVRDEIGVWFSNGWQEFAEFHSLGFGHFLVFEYEGCSRFSVVICDKTAVEIAYPISTTSEPNVEDIEDSFDTRIRKKSKPLSEVSPRQAKNKKKRMRGSISAENAAEMGSWTRIVSQADGSDDEQDGESKRMPSCARQCRAITGFTSPHPFFEVQITTSMLKKKRLLHVPQSFSSRHIPQNEKVVELQVRDETWSVAVVRKQNKYVKFAGGWLRFAKENLVKPGNFCVFECIRRWPNVILKVTIVRECV
ncbi:unnamed protein product [Linum tenue]|uniref:TF-B3 domain-containing protein n=1 Tax=Linum tenue TaxID=586396 RepID=A0AAV0L7X7_9ROSI|nr:unnamed protein product [Linum tenue]